MKEKILLVLALLLLINFSFATNFYVSTQRQASDSNPGINPNAPWASFDKIKSAWENTIKPGDTVHLERGSQWDVSFDADNSGDDVQYWRIITGGTPTSPIIVRGDDYGDQTKPKAILRRGDNYNTGQKFAILITGTTSHLVLRDFTIDGNPNPNMDSWGIMIGSGEALNSQTATMKDINILNMTIKNLASGTTTSDYASGIKLNTKGNHLLTDILIEGNDISGFTAWGIDQYSIKYKYSTNNLINNLTVRDNYVHDPAAISYAGVTGALHIMSGGNNNTWEYNHLEGNYKTGSIGIANCANDETNLKIRNNVIQNNRQGPGIWAAGDSEGTQEGIIIQGDIYNNLIINNAGSGINLDPEGQYKLNLNIYNNTLYNNIAPTSSGGEIAIWAPNDESTFNIKNNLLVHTVTSPSSTGKTRAVLFIANGFNGTITTSNNLYWNTKGTTHPAVYNGKTDVDYSIANIKNFEPTAQNSNPLFADITQKPLIINHQTGINPDGYKQLQESLTINSGISFRDNIKDIDGTFRPQNAIDIGAYEYVSAPTQVCGNGIIEETEQCDNTTFPTSNQCTDYNSIKYESGNLICNINCTINTNQCTPINPVCFDFPNTSYSLSQVSSFRTQWGQNQLSLNDFLNKIKIWKYCS